ncbi:MAG: LON peptidase substrate-binding domain-containing protein [Planctomycetota bacterium]
MELAKRKIPLFPLPNVVLFPKILLSLHVFEPRYKQLLSDVLDSHGLIAMPLLKAGETSVPGEEFPRVHRTVGIGRVAAYDTLPDARSNVMLVGVQRMNLVGSLSADQYFIGRFEEFEEREPGPVATESLRRALEKWLLPIIERASASIVAEADDSEGASDSAGASEKQRLQEFFGDESLGFLSDVLAHHYFEEPEVRQVVLEEADVVQRATQVLNLLEAMDPGESPTQESEGGLC